MKIEKFTQADIPSAAQLAYPVWGVGHADGGQGRDFGMLMCQYIVRYGWYGAPFALKVVDDEGNMLACILAGDHTVDNRYNDWLDALMPTFNESQRAEATALRAYFEKNSPRVYEHMTRGRDLYLSFFISSVPGCGKMLLAELMRLAAAEGYETMYLWTDSSCNHTYYAHHRFEKVAEFKSDEWKTDHTDYLTYIYKKVVEL